MFDPLASDPTDPATKAFLRGGNFWKSGGGSGRPQGGGSPLGVSSPLSIWGVDASSPWAPNKRKPLPLAAGTPTAARTALASPAAALPASSGGNPIVDRMLGALGGSGGGGAQQPAGDPYGTPASWEQTLFDAFNKGNKMNLTGLTWDAINAMIKSGWLDPMGNPQLIGLARDQALRDASGMLARNRTASQLLGMDPSQAASSYLQADMMGQGNVQRALMDAQLKSVAQNRDLLASILSQAMGWNFTPKMP